jgi:DNA-binding beta-propeller fold protein YncE
MSKGLWAGGFVAILLAGAAIPASAAPAYTLMKSVPLGAPDRWDYVVFNADTARIYAAHGDRIAVVDARTGALVDQVTGIAGGTHGVGISAKTGQGFTDDGSAGQGVAFDLKTLKVTKQIPADKDADAITFDKATGHIFIIEGDPGAITVVDPKTDQVAATIKAGEKMEYATSDDQGVVYVAGVEKRDLLKIDAKTNAVVARWPTPDCTSPHGLAMDRVGHRLFMGCINSQLMVVNSDTGAVVAKLPIGRGSDAIAWDPKRKRVFSPNGLDGTITVYQQTSPNDYKALEPVTTAVSGRTMDVDPSTGRLFVLAADTDPPAQPGQRPKIKPGTVKLMIFEPTP